MAFFSYALPPGGAPSRDTVPARTGVLTRFFRMFQEARLRQADREVALYLARTGGRLTDSVEREIEARFLAHDFDR